MNQILRWLGILLIVSCAMVFIDEALNPAPEAPAASPTLRLEPLEFEEDDSALSAIELPGESAGESEATSGGGAQTTSGGGTQTTSSAPVSSGQSSELLNAGTWGERMRLPSADEVAGYHATTRSPYIVCDPQFGIDGIIEYAVDFKADAQPRGTYLSICNLDLDTSSLNSQYTNVHRDYSGVAAYAGFQVHDDGTKAAIMSVWDTYVTDSSGTESIIHATRTYPDTYRVSQPFAGEGSGIQTIVDYDWKQGHAYRALIRCAQTDKGTCELAFFVMDLETGRWDELVAYDLGYGNTSITRAVCFLEDYLVNKASEVRTMELWNFRASTGGGSWVPAYSAIMSQNYDYPGSYNYGSDGTHFWAITSAIPGLCTIPSDGAQYSVSNAETGSPY